MQQGLRCPHAVQPPSQRSPHGPMRPPKPQQPSAHPPPQVHLSPQSTFDPQVQLALPQLVQKPGPQVSHSQSYFMKA
jgi:hypothetical protein